MSETEKFIERWSRRKREAVEESPPADAASEAKDPKPEGADEKKISSAESKQADAPFDVATLPSIESIGANSDVRAFMQAGVPLELRHAALRRAWSADVQIRDFIGLVENVGDFNDPNGIPGFGPLPEGFDIKSLLAQAIGSPQPDTAAPPAEAENVAAAQNNPEQNQPSPHDPPASPLVVDTSPAPQQEPVALDENSLPHGENHVALQDESANADSGPPPRLRGHGGALPK
ncbi:MAG: DUF3306 domain-containing protein [Pseudolabrys sp.]